MCYYVGYYKFSKKFDKNLKKIEIEKNKIN